MALDIFLAVAGAVLIIVGFAGTIVPVLPGAPLSWIGLLVAFFSEYTKISVVALVITGVIAVVVSIALEILAKKLKLTWLEPFVMPIGMIIAMVAAIVFFNVLPEEIAMFEWRG